jgi:hypothetical protein
VGTSWTSLRPPGWSRWPTRRVTHASEGHARVRVEKSACRLRSHRAARKVRRVHCRRRLERAYPTGRGQGTDKR